MTKAPNNINNLHKIQTFSLVQQFVSHSGSFDQLKSWTCLTTTRQVLTSSLRFGSGSSLAKLGGRFPKKLGLSKTRAKLPLGLAAGQSFPWLGGRRRAYFPTSCCDPGGPWGSCHQSLWESSSSSGNLSSSDVEPCNSERRASCSATPEPPESSFSFLGGRARVCPSIPLGCKVGTWAIPSPAEGETDGGRDLLWYYLKAKGVSEQ